MSCVEGDLCSKHKQCGEDQICCPNKCYRKRCVAGQATSAELAEESDEDSEEDKKGEETVEKATSGGARSGNKLDFFNNCTFNQYLKQTQDVQVLVKFLASKATYAVNTDSVVKVKFAAPTNVIENAALQELQQRRIWRKKNPVKRPQNLTLKLQKLLLAPLEKV